MPKERKAIFAKEYLTDLNATQAAIRAGYSPKTAKQQALRLMNRPDVQECIQQAMKEREERTNITADYVLTTIHETVERCRQSYPVLDRKGKQVYVETPEGDMLPAYVFDSKGVLKGCELLGKHLKLFVDRTEHTGANGGPIVVKLPDELE
jgi:phage terminase small subunit